jgi:hypothetical protein
LDASLATFSKICNDLELVPKLRTALDSSSKDRNFKLMQLKSSLEKFVS